MEQQSSAALKASIADLRKIISWKSNQQAKIDSREHILFFIDFPRSVWDLVAGAWKIT